MSLLSPTLNSPWAEISTTKGEKIKALGSLQWWQEDGEAHGHVKGTLTLQRRTFSTGISAWGGIAFRLCYDGHIPGEDQANTSLGAVTLPSDVGWQVQATKVKSENAQARIVVVKFPSNEARLLKLKITIPFKGSGAAEKLFGEALNFADQQCRSAIAANTPKTPKTPKHKNAKPAPKKTPKHPDYTTKKAAADTPHAKEVPKQATKKTHAKPPPKVPEKTAVKGKKTMAKRKLPKRAAKK